MKTLAVALLCLASLGTTLGAWRADAMRTPRIAPAASRPVALEARDDDDDDDDEEDEEDYRQRGLSALDLVDPGALEDALRLRALLRAH